MEVFGQCFLGLGTRGLMQRVLWRLSWVFTVCFFTLFGVSRLKWIIKIASSRLDLQLMGCSEGQNNLTL